MLEQYLKRLFQLLRRYKGRPDIAQLASHQDSTLKAIGEALSEAVSNTFSAEEETVIRLIEQQRDHLLRTDKEIPIIDYGAGNRSSKKTKEDMIKGQALTTSVANLCRASKSRFWATVLFKLIRKLEPVSCLELGSCVGISASYQSAALNINGKGRLITLEGSPEIANLAQETFDALSIVNASVVTGPFHETLQGVLEARQPIDFFFNDGHHDHDAVIQYFDDTLPYLAGEAIIVFDDISWSVGMRKAWHEIENHGRVAASIDLRSIGIALIRHDVTSKEKIRIPL